MLRFYGAQPPKQVDHLTLGGTCPHCRQGAKFSLTTIPSGPLIKKHGIAEIVLSYSCDLCLGPIPIKWKVENFKNDDVVVSAPKLILPVRESFEFDHVPDLIGREIGEALDCLSVGAFNGFAALCRRIIQAICTDLGAGASTKVQKQIEEMFTLTGLEKEWQELVLQIMLSGHDGAHPHLPNVDEERAAILLSLLRDLTYQLYTRPGKVKEAALLRKQIIEQK